MRLSAGRSTFAINTPVAAKIGSSISNCWTNALREQDSVHARIAQLQSRITAKLMEYCTRTCDCVLGVRMLFIFLGCSGDRSVPEPIPSLASVHRMSQSSERTLAFDHKLQGHRLAETRKQPESPCDSVNRHDFQNSYRTQMQFSTASAGMDNRQKSKSKENWIWRAPVRQSVA